MKIRELGVILLIINILIILSCTREDHWYKNGESCTLRIFIDMEAGTKTTNSQTQTQDNNIETLDVFVFRETSGKDNGVLDAYKRFHGSEIANMNGISLNTTTGPKHICAIANSHIDDYKSIIDLSSFQKIECLLVDEKLSDFTMTGSIKASLGITSSVTIPLSRLISCITISSIRTSFSGTPYQGESLTNVKVYLINAIGNKLVLEGGTAKNTVILNKGRKVETDVSECKQRGLLFDEIEGPISDDGYTQCHYLYCYENTISSENGAEKFTRVVIQGDLAGNTYYYPININQEGFGYVSSNGHYGIKRNTRYTISAIIQRPGSTEPDSPVTHGSISSSITIKVWDSTSDSNIIF